MSQRAVAVGKASVIAYVVNSFFLLFVLDKMTTKDDGSPSNPMLYDPIPEGPGDTKKLMQFVAATIGMKYEYFQ